MWVPFSVSCIGFTRDSAQSGRLTKLKLENAIIPILIKKNDFASTNRATLYPSIIVVHMCCTKEEISHYIAHGALSLPQDCFHTIDCAKLQKRPLKFKCVKH